MNKFRSDDIVSVSWFCVSVRWSRVIVRCYRVFDSCYHKISNMSPRGEIPMVLPIHAKTCCRPRPWTAVQFRLTANINNIIYRYGSVESSNSQSTANLCSNDLVDSTCRDFGIYLTPCEPVFAISTRLDSKPACPHTQSSCGVLKFCISYSKLTYLGSICRLH